MHKFIFLVFSCVLILNIHGYSQATRISENKKNRYLKKIEKKNTRYVKQEEKKLRKLLTTLSSKEKKLPRIDSIAINKNVSTNTFSKINERLNNYCNPPEKLTNTSTQQLSPNAISPTIDAEIKNYLRQQIATSHFLNDTTCKTCEKLKKQTTKTQITIAATSQQLERLKVIENDIKKHQETLKNYYANTPELSSFNTFVKCKRCCQYCMLFSLFC